MINTQYTSGQATFYTMNIQEIALRGGKIENNKIAMFHPR